MKARIFISFLGAALLAVALAGCSFSASASTGAATLHGKDKILITAERPEAPPTPVAKPEPAPEPKPVAVKPIKVRRAKLVGKKIEINEKVMFDYNKATIKTDSHQLLKDVAEVITEHPEIEKVQVEGHTDSDGKDDYNKKLSQGRADSVKAFLVSLGVQDARLEALGFGEEKPIDTADTAEAKEKNRRVEFNIVSAKSGSGKKVDETGKKAIETGKKAIDTETGKKVVEAGKKAVEPKKVVR